MGTPKSRTELCRDCTETGEAVQSCVLPKIAAQGSKNATRYHGEETSHQKRGRFLLTASRNFFRTST